MVEVSVAVELWLKTRRVCVRAFSRLTPRLSRALAAIPSPSRINPNRRCSVPIPRKPQVGEDRWTVARVRTPEQFERWSWLVAIAFNQLYLARDLGQAAYHPWERKDRPVTPRQVRRVMLTLLSQLGTPARPCQPRGKAPGRAKGFHPKPAKRFSVIIKNSKKKKKSAMPLQSSA